MKLWMIITFASHIGAVVGPLPMDMQTCHEKQIGIEQEWDENYIKKDLAHSNVMIVNGVRLKRSDIKTHCVWWNTRPEFTSGKLMK